MTDYYYNITTGQVEEGPQSSMPHLLGPYPTREKASRALQIAAERNEAWDEEEEEWQDWGEDGRAR